MPNKAPHDHIIDARGHHCPVPTLKLRRYMAQADPDTHVVLLADDPMAQIDVPHFCHQNNYVVLAVDAVSDGWRFHIWRP